MNGNNGTARGAKIDKNGSNEADAQTKVIISALRTQRRDISRFIQWDYADVSELRKDTVKQEQFIREICNVLANETTRF